uniref:Secreted protein n=1 Tax=Angiostrongylus cantonensis TaxID=6313 RepID=A0A0K0DCL6_ANGCA
MVLAQSTGQISLFLCLFFQKIPGHYRTNICSELTFSVRQKFTLLSARASGVLLVAGVGSYCAYRICTRFLGQRYMFPQVDRLFFSFCYIFFKENVFHSCGCSWIRPGLTLSRLPIGVFYTPVE